jgi:hypothetical protein
VLPFLSLLTRSVARRFHQPGPALAGLLALRRIGGRVIVIVVLVTADRSVAARECQCSRDATGHSPRGIETRFLIRSCGSGEVDVIADVVKDFSG